MAPFVAVKTLEDGTTKEIVRGDKEQRELERKLLYLFLKNACDSLMNRQRATDLNWLFEKKDPPTGYDQVVEDEKARADAVFEIVSLSRMRLYQNHPPPAEATRVQKSTTQRNVNAFPDHQEEADEDRLTRSDGRTTESIRSISEAECTGRKIRLRRWLEDGSLIGLPIDRIRDIKRFLNQSCPSTFTETYQHERQWRQIRIDVRSAELMEFRKEHPLGEASFLAAHLKSSLLKTNFVANAPYPEYTTHITARKEPAATGSVLAPYPNDRTIRSLDSVFWPIKAVDFEVVAGYTAMSVGGNYLNFVEPDMVLFMGNGIKMPWASKQMQDRAGHVFQWFLAHDWKTLTNTQVHKLTESLRKWRPSISITFTEVTTYMCWWLKSVAYLYKLIGESDNFKTACRFVVEFDKECPSISTDIIDLWTRIMGDVLDIKQRYRFEGRGETTMLTADGTQVWDGVQGGAETTPAITTKQVGAQAQQEGLDPPPRCDSQQPRAREAAQAEAAPAEIHIAENQCMKQPGCRKKQRKRLRVLARTDVHTKPNRKSKKLLLGLTFVLKPIRKNLLRRRGVARLGSRSQTRAILAAMAKPTRKLPETTTRKQDRDLAAAKKVSLLAAVAQANETTVPTQHYQQAGNSGAGIMGSDQDKDSGDDESTKKVTWRKAQEMYDSDEYDPDISYAIHDEIPRSESDEEDYQDALD